MTEQTHAGGGVQPDGPVDGEDRVLTLPNLITLVRALCIPLFLWLLFGRDNRLAAAALLAALGATDWVDGYVARRLGQVSNLGKAFDPTVDRLLMVVGIGAIMIEDLQIDWFMPFAWVVVVREVLLSTFVVLTIALGARRMDVTWFGKAGTFGMMVAFPAFLASADQSLSDTAATAFLWVAWLSGIPGLIFGMIAFVGYLPAGLRALQDGRRARSAVAAPGGR